LKHNIGNTLYQKKNYEQALQEYEGALSFDTALEQSKCITT
jgi:tetratricopeptide (TPR) repeat protein